MNVKSISEIYNSSYKTEVKYSHDCWGSSERDEYLVLDFKLLSENLLSYALSIINNRLVGCSLEEREILHALKDDFRKNFK